MDKKKGGIDFIFVGLALFAMFFGAGNLIFPPELGVKSGPMWFIGFLCFLIADAGLAVLGVIAMGKVDGDINNVTGTIGKKAAVILNTVVILCIGSSSIPLSTRWITTSCLLSNFLCCCISINNQAFKGC